MKSNTLTPKQTEDAKATGRCPSCELPMKQFKSPATGKHELYCESCHLSVPLWKN